MNDGVERVCDGGGEVVGCVGGADGVYVSGGGFGVLVKGSVGTGEACVGWRTCVSVLTGLGSVRVCVEIG